MNATSVPAATVQTGAEQDREVSFVPAWRPRDPALEQHAQEFWRKLNMIPEPEIRQRSKQLCAAAYAVDGLAAVATAEPVFLSQLRFLHYRCAVSPSHRRQEIAWRITAFAHDLLQKWSLVNPQEKFSGFLIAMEAREFAGHIGAPIIPKHGLNLVFIGYKPTGEQLRAIWFKHANVEERVHRADVEAADVAAMG